MTPRQAAPLLAVETREQLVYLLTQACELEHGVMCEYLFVRAIAASPPGHAGSQLR